MRMREVSFDQLECSPHAETYRLAGVNVSAWICWNEKIFMTKCIYREQLGTMRV